MTVDRCIEEYLSSARVVLTEKNMRDILDLLLKGETLTNTAKKLNLKVSNVSTARNAFENKCGIVFPNAKRTHKKYDYKLKKVELNDEEDISELIEKNQEIKGSILRRYIAETLDIPYEKANKLFSEYMKEYCKFKGEWLDKAEIEIKLEKYLFKSRHSRETVMEVVERVNAKEERKVIAKDLGLTSNELQSIIYRLRELGYIKL